MRVIIYKQCTTLLVLEVSALTRSSLLVPAFNLITLYPPDETQKVETGCGSVWIMYPVAFQEVFSSTGFASTLETTLVKVKNANFPPILNDHVLTCWTPPLVNEYLDLPRAIVSTWELKILRFRGS